MLINAYLLITSAYECPTARQIALFIGIYSMSSRFPLAYQNGNGPLGKRNTTAPGQTASKLFRSGIVYGMLSAFQP